MPYRHHLLLACYICIFSFACQPNPNPENHSIDETSNMNKATITQNPFGTLPDGTAIDIFTLTNNNGLEAKITNYGGIVTSLKVPDKQGKLEDIVLGFDSLPQYLDGHPYFGSIVGRYGNRIAKGKFSLDGVEYDLAKNNGPNHLHGGLKGFDKVAWTPQAEKVENGVALKLNYLSKDMEEGYPGNLNVEVVYTLTNDNELKIDYSATTDKKTVVNLTHHGYFNLTGNAKRDILAHELTINADSFISIDKTLIPVGKMQTLDGSPLDFRTAKAIGKDINAKDQQIEYGLGYDHCWVLSGPPSAVGSEQLVLAAKVNETESGRAMEVWTTEPGLQFYSGNFLDGTLTGKYGVVYQKRFGFCLETEHFPDSPNQASFPSTVLKPGEVYKTGTVYKFTVQ